MAMQERPLLSIRAAAWSAAQCVRHWCSTLGLADERLYAFCQHLEAAARAENLAAWDALEHQLQVTGLGDALPAPLDAVPGLAALLEAAHEVTASQMYTVWTPDQVRQYLGEAAALAGLPPDAVLARTALLHRPDHNGWGPAVDQAELDRWATAVRNDGWAAAPCN